MSHNSEMEVSLSFRDKWEFPIHGPGKLSIFPDSMIFSDLSLLKVWQALIKIYFPHRQGSVYYLAKPGILKLEILGSGRRHLKLSAI